MNFPPHFNRNSDRPSYEREEEERGYYPREQPRERAGGYREERPISDISNQSASGLREGDLKRHDRMTGSTPSAPRDESPRRKGAPSPRAETATVASTVGTQWRLITGQKGKVKSGNHPSRVPGPYGKRMALLVGLDDESHAAFNSCKTMETLLVEFGYCCETVLDTSENEAQFELDVESGLAELVALSAPGDAMVLFAVNYGPTGRHSASSLLHRLAINLPPKVRATCIFDCCYLTAKPAYRVDFKQEKIYTAKSAGLKHHRRLAQPMGDVSQKVPSDIFVFSGENPTGKTMTCRTPQGMHGVYTAAMVRAFRAKDIKGLFGVTPSFSTLAEMIES